MLAGDGAGLAAEFSLSPLNNTVRTANQIEKAGQIMNVIVSGQ